MSENNKVHIVSSPKTNPTIARYILGFVLSLALTIVPFLLIIQDIAHGSAAVAALIFFALCQFFVQVIFFLHIVKGDNKRWNVLVLLFTVLVVLIVVIGSLWIMYHLDYNMMSPIDIDQAMTEEAQKGF